MAKSTKSIILSASALCFLSLILTVASHDTDTDTNTNTTGGRLFVEGQVFCDPCHAQFITRISTYLEGAKVRLECRDREGGDLKYTVDGVTKAAGFYQLPVEGDHEEEVCEILLVESPDPECNEVSTDSYLKKTARISLTTNNGIASTSRLANPLGFMKNKPMGECTQVLRELGITAEGFV